MTLAIDPNNRTPVHLDAVAYVPRVPSRREAEAAYAKLLADLSFDQANALGAEIETVRDFICSR